MGPRISIPKISAFGLSQITTPAPLSPQTKRIFRNTLPASPLTPPSPQCPPPPREPYPFLWQCCSCYTVYQFSTTRRCLLCSHKYCTREVAFASNSDPSSGGNSSNGSGSGSKKRRRRKNKYCRSEFDYEGWAAWGKWRRGHALRIESADEEDADAELEERERKFIKKTHNCVVHCDFPSQCFHTQIRVLEDELRDVTAAAAREAEEEIEAEESLKLEEDEILLAYAASSKPGDGANEEAEDEDRLELNLAVDLPENDDDDEDEVSPTSPSSKSPFFYDDNKSQNSGAGVSGSGRGRGGSYPVVIPGIPSSPAVDASKLTDDELFALIDEDDDMMPLEDSRAGRDGADSRLSMRNPSEVVDWADLHERDSNGGSDGDDDDMYRPSSRSSSSSSSSSDWEDMDDEDMEVLAADQELSEEEAAMRDFKRARHAFMIEA